jgi:hypothetical protein
MIVNSGDKEVSRKLKTQEIINGFNGLNKLNVSVLHFENRRSSPPYLYPDPSSGLSSSPEAIIWKRELYLWNDISNLNIL